MVVNDIKNTTGLICFMADIYREEQNSVSPLFLEEQKNWRPSPFHLTVLNIGMNNGGEEGEGERERED
jgi:hypothetical protein